MCGPVLLPFLTSFELMLSLLFLTWMLDSARPFNSLSLVPDGGSDVGRKTRHAQPVPALYRGAKPSKFSG
jgi:hypothetical protein